MFVGYLFHNIPFLIVSHYFHSSSLAGGDGTRVAGVKSLLFQTVFSMETSCPFLLTFRAR